MATCIYEGCIAEAEQGRKGMCQRHYMQDYRAKKYETDDATPGDHADSDGTETDPDGFHGTDHHDDADTYDGERFDAEGNPDPNGSFDADGDNIQQDVDGNPLPVDGDGDGDGDGETDIESDATPSDEEIEREMSEEERKAQEVYNKMKEALGESPMEKKLREKLEEMAAKLKEEKAKKSDGPKYEMPDFGDMPKPPSPEEMGPCHKIFGRILQQFHLGHNVALVGPAGSGKTSACYQAAAVLQLEFYSTGAVFARHEVEGFIDAKGDQVMTAFVRWATSDDGGVFLFDELDASLPKALTAFHEAIDNKRVQLPSGDVVQLSKRHLMIACLNTYGDGANRQYVGRNILDGATMDRFVVLTCGYDADFENQIFGVFADDKFTQRRAKWVGEVQDIRRAIEDLRLEHIVSMRASRHGADHINAGMKLTQEDKRTYLGFDKLDPAQVTKIKNRVKEIGSEREMANQGAA